MKLNAVELYLSSELSAREVAHQAGISNSTMVASWVSKYRQHGIDGLSSKRGRPPMKETKSKLQKLKEIEETTEEFTPSVTAHIKELESQIRALQIENACLKEWRRLRNAQLPKSNDNISKFIHSLRGLYQLNEILEVLEFPKSTYMYWQKRFKRGNPDEELEIKQYINYYNHDRMKVRLGYMSPVEYRQYHEELSIA